MSRVRLGLRLGRVARLNGFSMYYGMSYLPYILH